MSPSTVKGNGDLPELAARHSQIAFASVHSLVDPASGAAVATARALSFLAKVGFATRAFCGSQLDVPGEELIEELLARRGLSYEVRRAVVAGYETRLLFAELSGVPVTAVLAASTQGGWTSEDEAGAAIAAFRSFLTAERPAALLTYGGDAVTQSMIGLAKHLEIPVVFGLHNFSYTSRDAFGNVDHVAVPSEFSRSYYRDRLGLDCNVLPNVVDDETVRIREWQPEYVTFVNPQPSKGVFVFAAIASELGRRRPEIPLLVVEGRGQAGQLLGTELDLCRFGNVRLMPNTVRPADFYEPAMLVLMPSLWNESFGLVAAEAMYNGIPVLASNRGALPETIGKGGYLFDIPAAYTPQTRDIPTAEEVEPWVETIIRLWDDPQEYAAACDRARNHAQRWHPDRLAPLYREFFSNLAPQPFPPLAPPGVR